MPIYAQNILILEDDLETLENILRILQEVEKEKKVGFSTTVLPDYEKTETYINKNPQIKFDILLLDRDCYLAGSFHVVDLENFDIKKVIAISSNPDYNKQALEKGVRVAIWKDFSNLKDFSEKLKKEIIDILSD